MPTTYKTPFSTQGTHAHRPAESFFARPASRWLSLVLFIATSLLLIWVFGQNPTLEYALKACLFSIPVTGYVLYRSFILHE
jgi:hypothetical protein